MKTRSKQRDHSGSSFDSVEQERIREEVEAVAIERVQARQLEQAMQKQQEDKRSDGKPVSRLNCRVVRDSG